jgi:NarL family two-component system response regulator LiaR
MAPIRLLIVDDHAIVRTGLSAVFETEDDLELVGQATNGIEAQDKVKELNPDVILMDIIMPQMGGIDAIKAIREFNPEAKILVLSSFTEDEKVLAAIKSGASGYILKDSSPEELVLAIRDVNAGKPSLHPSITRLLMEDISPRKDPKNLEDPLTEREIEVLVAIAKGLSNQEIADQLTISHATVRFHVTNILQKLNLENRTQAALYALKEGLTTLD